jgi:hypothetical protein
MLFVYVITMDAKREARTLLELNNAGIENIRIVQGVDGNTNAAISDPRLSHFCQALCTDRMRGCALAHANAWDMVRRYHDDDADNIVLIVEDDVRISRPYSFVKDVHKMVQSMPDDWDIISLFCQGFCVPSISLGRGSTAAYLLSKQGCQRLKNLKIGYHVDFLQNSLRTYMRPLVDTYDDREGFVIGNQTITFWAEQDILSIGGWRLNTRRLFLLLCALLGAAWILPASAWASKIVLKTASLCLLVFVLTLLLYFSTPASLGRSPDDYHEFMRCITCLLLISSCSLFFFSYWCTTACVCSVLSLCILHSMNGA